METTVHEESLASSVLLDLEAFSTDLDINEGLPELSLGLVVPPDPSLTIEPYVNWFLTPEAFVVDHTMMPLPSNFKISGLKDCIDIIKAWMVDWVKTGSNAFIHAQLYQDCFPACLQIAYTTLSAYHNRTEATTHMILRAVNDQATALVSRSDEARNSKSLIHDLAHIHALLAYQMIGLFDGDIRSRYLAEKRVQHLAKLSESALEKASVALARDILVNDSSLRAPGQTSSSELFWHAWIMSESLRRTWLVVQSIRASYDGLKQGWAQCHGGLMFTSRQGLWSAKSAFDWCSICAEHDVRFVGRFQLESLLHAPSAEVDEFGKAMVKSLFGKERLESWVENLTINM